MISNNSNLGYPITCSIQSGERFEVHLDESMTKEDVITKIANRIAVPPSHVRICYAGRTFTLKEGVFNYSNVKALGLLHILTYPNAVD